MLNVKLFSVLSKCSVVLDILLKLTPAMKIYVFVYNNFDLSVDNMINELDLKKPVFAKTACYGHFGNPEFSWEKIKKCNVD